MDTRRWEQIGALGGIVYVVLQGVAQALIQTGGAEPAFSAGATEIMDFFMNRNRQLAGLGDFFNSLSLIAFIWFLGSLWAALRRAEGEPAWLSLVALGSGLMAMTPFVAGGGWTLAIGRLDAGLDPEIARMLFDQGNFGFANLWVALASMLVAVGVLSIQKDALPRWLGWSGLVIAAGLVVARAFWVGPSIVFTPYGIFWLWLIAASIVLMRRAGGGQQAG